MTWRPKHLIEGRLDNRTPGKVTGWLRFYCSYKRLARAQLLRLTRPRRRFPRGREGHGALAPARPQRPKRGQAFGPECSLKVSHPSARCDGRHHRRLPLGRWTEDVSSAILTRQELRWDKLRIHGNEREALRREVVRTHRRHIEARDRFYAFAQFPYVESSPRPTAGGARPRPRSRRSLRMEHAQATASKDAGRALSPTKSGGPQPSATLCPGSCG
jgi:hypothetical protein